MPSCSPKWLYKFTLPLAVDKSSCQQLALSDGLIFSNLMGVKWYLFVGLICIFLISIKIVHLYICSVDIYFSLLWIIYSFLMLFPPKVLFSFFVNQLKIYSDYSYFVIVWSEKFFYQYVSCLSVLCGVSLCRYGQV